MEDGLPNIKPGTTVNIQRTDGRVHAAVVSAMNRQTKSVTVEWFEDNETKGKEIDLDIIMQLNSQLMSFTSSGGNDSFNSSMIPVGNKLARNSTKASIPTMSNIKGSYSSRKVTGRATNVFPLPTSGSSASLAGTAGSTPTTPSANTAGKNAHIFAVPLPVQNSIQHAPSQQNIPKGDKRSNVVKEVEKLKKNREVRRQKQAELREQKEALMNVDPGNPNWEFLSMIRQYQSNIEFRPLADDDPTEDHLITVCVRKRPLSQKEVARKEVDVVTVPSKNQIVVHEPKSKVDLTKYLENQLFRFDYAFDESCTNELVYKYSAKPLVRTIFEGGMATCFAYGQTGSGKTHTMGGNFHGKMQDCKKGIYAMAASDVFQLLRSAKYKPLNLVVSASFFEIYSGKVFDLLADKAKLRVLEDGRQQVQVVGLTETIVDSVEDVLKIIQKGNSARTSGQTSANSNSSRSHAVFQIMLRNPNVNKIHGKFSLIDLAGNERGADTRSSNRQTRMEGAEINKSLLALKECIRALGRGSSHLPFRASKLTQVLKDSFIGDKSRTCMIAMISPGMSSCEHSLNTLRYADRVKELTATDPCTENKGLSNSNNNHIHDDDAMETLNGDDEMEVNDLSALRSLNDGEISAELLNFHAAVSHLQELEDEVLDMHKEVTEMEIIMQESNKALLTRTRDVDYDQDAYSRDLIMLAREKVAMAGNWQTLIEKTESFRQQLVAEESISRTITTNGHQRYN